MEPGPGGPERWNKNSRGASTDFSACNGPRSLKDNRGASATVAEHGHILVSQLRSGLRVGIVALVCPCLLKFSEPALYCALDHTSRGNPLGQCASPYRGQAPRPPAAHSLDRISGGNGPDSGSAGPAPSAMGIYNGVRLILGHANTISRHHCRRATRRDDAYPHSPAKCPSFRRASGWFCLAFAADRNVRLGSRTHLDSSASDRRPLAPPSAANRC